MKKGASRDGDAPPLLQRVLVAQKEGEENHVASLDSCWMLANGRAVGGRTSRRAAATPRSGVGTASTRDTIGLVHGNNRRLACDRVREDGDLVMRAVGREVPEKRTDTSLRNHQRIHLITSRLE